jgi:phage-related minor tail protein
MTDPQTLGDAEMAGWTTTVKIEADASGFERETRKATSLGDRFARTLTDAFAGIALKGKSLGDTLRALALQLSNLVLKAALKPLEQGLGNLFNGLFSGILPFAKGGAVQGGLPVPFAHGGVIQSPVTFPLAGGRTGLAGERGPEAIVPLARGPDGRLGIAAPSGGGGVNVTFNVTSPDADSFRRSETQLAAMLTRAVALGRRNL